MLNFSAARRIFIARQPQDMRRGIDTLSAVVQDELHEDPYAGDCFIFLSRNRCRMKVVFWEEGGFWICQKRLEAGTFANPDRWCHADTPTVVVTPAQVLQLLEGIDVTRAKYRVRQRYAVGNSPAFVKCRHGRNDHPGRIRAAGGQRDAAAAREDPAADWRVG